MTLSSCLSAAGVCLTTSALAADPATTLVVDASTRVVQSDSGDDLATLQNIFQDANAPQDGSGGGATDPRRGVISDIKMKRMRILQGDTYCDIDAKGNFGNRPFPDASGNYPAVVAGDCNLLKWQIDWALVSGLSPHVAVASTLPVTFALKYGAAETWPKQSLGGGATPLDLYKSYANQLVRYIAQTAFGGGASSVTIEVSNELDIAESGPQNFPSSTVPWSLLPLGPWGRYLWWIDPASYQLNQWPGNDASPTSNPTWYPYVDDFRRVDRGIAPMQKIFGDAIQALNNDANFRAQYPGKTVAFAGPAFSGSSLQWINYWTPAVRYTLEEWFLDEMLNPAVTDPSTGKVAPYNTSLDYFSFHYYGDFRNGMTSVSPSDPNYNLARQPTTLKNLTDRIRTKLAALGHPETKLFVSEWGPSADLSGDINYSHKGAAWAAAFLTEAVADHISMGSYLVVDDATGDASGARGLASLLYKDSSGNYFPKPPANVFKMFSMMTGARRAVTLPTATPYLGAFASTDANSAGVLVFNYNYDYSFTDTPQTFSVELDNLPFNGVVTVQRYLVDANTSNLAAYLSQPGQPDPRLQQVEQFTAQVIGGQLTLPARTLGLGVTLWRVVS